MIIDLPVLVLSILMLWFGAKYLVDSASRIAGTLGVSDLVIGLTVVAFGTSAPEFAVTIGAAMKGNANIPVSNIVGSNIFNVGFILGAVAIVKTIQTSRKLVYRDGLFLIGVTLLLLFFFHNLVLTKVEGIVLISLLLAYLLFLFFKKEAFEEEDTILEKATWKDFLIFPLSIASIVGGGNFLVDSAVGIARVLGISEWVIGITIVAAGTSAPEMATSLAAVLKEKHGISAGNLIGSNIFNILGVLGLAGILKPLTITPQGLGSIAMLSVMMILVIIFLRTGWRLSRTEGIILTTIGIIIIIYSYVS